MYTMHLNHFILKLAISPALYGIIFVVIGYISKKKHPDKISMYWGYRTLRSMSSPSAWNEANMYSNLLMIKIGFASVFIGIIIALLVNNSIVIGIGTVGISIVFSIHLITETEKMLKKNFDEHGNRISR